MQDLLINMPAEKVLLFHHIAISAGQSQSIFL